MTRIRTFRWAAGWVAAAVMLLDDFPPRPRRYRRRHGAPGGLPAWRPKWWPRRHPRGAEHAGATADWSPVAEVAAAGTVPDGATLAEVLAEVDALLARRLPDVRLDPRTARTTLAAWRADLGELLSARTLRPAQPRRGLVTA